MAARGPKPRRGRAKPPAEAEGEPLPEPATGPEASLPAENGLTAEGEAHPPEEAPPPHHEEKAEALPEIAEPGGTSEQGGPEEPGTWNASHLVIAGLGLLVIVAALASVLYYASAGNSEGLDRLATRLDSLATEVEGQAGRLDSVENAMGGLQSDVGQVTTAVNQLQTSLSGLQAAIEDVRSAVSTSGAGSATAELPDELTASIARLEDEVSRLRQQAAERSADTEAATALGRAYAALTERIAAGAPFADELEALTAELPTAPGLERLRPFAGEGVPTLPDLQARLGEIASELPEDTSGESTAAGGDGLWDTMRQRLDAMVTVRREDEADWAAVLARAGEALQGDDLEAAITEIEQASEAAPAGIESWLADARARREVQAGLDELADAVMRQFAGRQ